jgi:hypothetical protein
MRRRHAALLAAVFTAVLIYIYRLEIERAYMLRSGGCTASSGVGVLVRPLIDARTGAEIPHEVAMRGTLIVRDGSYADTVALLAGAANDRPGVYDVTVRLPGYREWRRSRVRVQPRRCSVRTTYLHAEVQPTR